MNVFARIGALHTGIKRAVLTKGINPAGLAQVTANPQSFDPSTGVLSTLTPDAIHKWERNGRWYATPQDAMMSSPIQVVGSPAPTDPIITVSTSAANSFVTGASASTITIPAAPVAQPIQEAPMATTPVTSKTSVLSKIGNFFKTFFSDVVKIGEVAEPVIDLALPGIAPLYNSALNAIVAAEAASAGATGTGPQKLAYVVGEIEPIALAWLKSNNITMDTTQFQAWISAIVASLNLIPAPTPTP